MSETVEFLKNNAKFHKYFWNGLFVALYEPYRESHPVSSLPVNGGTFFIPESESTIKNYLSCKQQMDFDKFQEFCKGIHINIESKRLIEVVPYINQAMVYLNEMDTSGKASRSKKERQKILVQYDDLSKEEKEKAEAHLWEQYLAQDEKERTEIIETLSNLTPEELSLLYRVADGYPDTCGWDDIFMECYCIMNEHGQSLFRETLENEKKKWNVSYHDKFCDFCREMAAETVTPLQDVTPEILCDKLEKAFYNFLPEDAKNLLKYRNAQPETWKILEEFHQVIRSYPEENIDEQTFTEAESLLIFLHRLADIPSLQK